MTARGATSTGADIVSLKDAHKGSLEIDLRIMNQYQKQPQKLLDFYTDCRAALTGKNPNQALAKVCSDAKQLKLGGPMLGDITAAGVSVWMHLPEVAAVDVKVTPEAGGTPLIFKSEKTERIFTVRCDGLSAASAYTYEVTDAEGRDLGKGRFVTPPAELSEKPFRIAFGADFHKVGMYRPELLRLVQERGSLAMLLYGDLAVDGRKDDFALINTDYMLRNLSPVMQKLTANVPVTATWDDHDYWGNDTSGQRTNGNKPIDVEGLRNSWGAHWNNPERDVKREGIYFQTRIGPVHYIALDTRSCRAHEKKGEKGCFLGKTQTAWLKQQIEKSDAPYIIVSGGTMWTDNISNGKDSWGAWDTEAREEIFQWLDAKQDSFVIFLSGDRHGARGFTIPRPDGRQFYELEVGTLGGVPGPGAYDKDRSNQLFGYPGRSWAFGELTFNKDDTAPQAEFCLINEEGKELERISLKK